MLSARQWDVFIKFLEEDRGCVLADDTDWAYPIYKQRGTGYYAGLDLSEELDDFLICAVCHELHVDPPDGHDHGEMSVVKSIKSGFLPGVPPSSSN